ncbi:unnamed protein product [Clonostachys rosea]|uniref:F-box domain-containing protein n=1 Tax=Bionectria ochroleuca TaxID=29856 RepID=A0ABY6UTC9_BIOOC|nr:unnamed protein product [Clonostachys rosea]
MDTSNTTDLMPSPPMSSMASPSSEPPAGLLTVPLEIRLQIYSYLLEVPEFSPYTLPSKKAPVAGALLRTNRQINWEATPYLYAHNTFVAHPTLLTSFPRLRPNVRPVSDSYAVSLIHRFHLTVHLDSDLPFDAEALTKSFTGTEELTLHLVQSMFCGAGYANLRQFEGIRGVKRVTIEGSTTGLEDYIEWLRKTMMSEPDAPMEEFKHETVTLTDRLARGYLA